ncbi:unnamed protein product, partial [Rodentolepis nana]|uniref:Reverse transcriptase domain-containing protein n=1 Tax=Rodentolepis nana TaxID=102285 RepID=A0A0R3T725_RODNA
PSTGSCHKLHSFQCLHHDIAELVQAVTGIECLLNADDLVQWYSAPKKNAQERTESALNCGLKLLANRCDNNGMVINTAKTAFQTYLGMMVDTKLTWKSHIAKIAERVFKTLDAVKSLDGSIWGCAHSTLNTTYKMIIQPIMLYCCEPLITAAEKAIELKKELQIDDKPKSLSPPMNPSADTDVACCTKLLDFFGKSNTPPEQMRSLALETINVNYPGDQWLQVFTAGHI